MSLRCKLFLFPLLAIIAAAGLVAFGSEQYARRQAQQAGQQHTQALAAQFQREITQRGDEVARAVQRIADAESTLRMALDLTRPQADPSVYANDARGLANVYHLDFLELAAADGTLISSSHWAPASGYHNDWVAKQSDWSQQSAFLSRVALPDKVELGLLAVRPVKIGERNLYVIGGWRFDRAFLRTLAVPEGMRALLYANLEQRFVPEALTGADGPSNSTEPFAPMIESLQRGESQKPWDIQSPEQGGAETFIAAPLLGRGGELLGALLVGSSQRDLAELVRYIRLLGLAAAGFGILFSVALAWWISASVSRPIAQLAGAARELQSGKWAAGTDLHPRGETAPIATALNALARQIPLDRERLVQRERVAARREMAQRFARDIKESIFPLHMAAEDLIDAQEEGSGRFDEIFHECSTSMRSEIERLKGFAARLGEFGRTSRPQPVPVGVNEIARVALQAIEPHFRTTGRPPITPEVHLGEPEPFIEADPAQLRSALENLLLHCLDAMPAGGTLAVRTHEKDSHVHIEVSAKGASLSAQDGQRLFVPAGVSPEGMTGLGFATAHAVVTDHGGHISAESHPDAGTTLHIEFAAAAGARPRQAKSASAQPKQTESPQPARAESAQPVAMAAVRQTPAEVSVASASAEPVAVTILAVETIEATEEQTAVGTEPSAEDTTSKATFRPRRGLTFTS